MEWLLIRGCRRHSCCATFTGQIMDCNECTGYCWDVIMFIYSTRCLAVYFLRKLWNRAACFNVTLLSWSCSSYGYCWWNFLVDECFYRIFIRETFFFFQKYKSVFRFIELCGGLAKKSLETFLNSTELNNLITLLLVSFALIHNCLRHESYSMLCIFIDVVFIFVVHLSKKTALYMPYCEIKVIFLWRNNLYISFCIYITF